MVQLSVAAVGELLSRHQLLDGERLAEIQHDCARFADGRELAQDLMRRGWLTAFQVNQIFLGRAEDLVVGQFVLLDGLGEGGMGQVFKAWQRNLQRIVALKVIRKECLQNPRMIQRFQREIRAAGKLAHPHIVHAYDASQENGGYFIAMEYIEGQDLARMVAQSGPLAVAQACDFLRQAALGLQHAYEHGLVHRDIKPANLLWTSGKGPASGLLRRPVLPGSGLQPRPGSGLIPRPGSGLLARPGTFPWGIVKILDLGLARWIESDAADANHLTQLGSFMGTPDFMAPEQALNSHECDIRSDVYSLGCTFYFMLTGEVPFPGGSVTDKIIRHQKEEPEPVEAVRYRNLTSAPDTRWTAPLDASQVDTPVSVACLVRRLLAKNPSERVQTPGELAEMLEEIQNDPGRASIPPALACRTKPVPRPSDSTVTDTSVPPAALEPAATIVSVEEPLEFSLPEILPPYERPVRRRRLAPFLVVAVAIAAGTLAAVIGGHGRPRADTTSPPEDALWHDLQARLHHGAGEPSDLRLELIRFRTRYPQHKHADDVAGMIARMPSPLDRLVWKQPWLDKLGPRPRGLVTVLGQGAGPVRTLAFSPDGHFLVSAGARQVRYWNMARLDQSDGTTPVHFPAHAERIQRVAFLPEGRQFATACLDGTCKIWDTTVPGCVLSLQPQKQGINAVAFSPTGKTLATAGQDGRVCLWDRSTGNLLHAISGRVGAVLSLTFSPDGRFVFWGGENHQVRWADAGSGKTAAKQVFAGSKAWINVLAFHPNGADLVLGGGGDGLLHLCRWDGQQIHGRRTLNHHAGFVSDLSYAPDGSAFVTVSEDRTIKLWQGHTGALIKSWDMPLKLCAAAFAPDCRHFAVGNAPPGPNRGAVFIFRVPADVRVASR